ncbi:hypothetical protein OIU84_025188, partial [Salix udensis]
MGGEEN